MTTFTADDIGKSVENAVGDEIGVIADVDGETAYVDPEPGMIDTIKAVFDWEGGADETVPLADDAVKNVTADTVQIEQAAPAESITTAADPGDDPEDVGPDADDAGEKRDVDYSPGQPVESTVTETETDGPGSDLGTGADDLEDPVPETSGGVEDAEGRDSETRHTADEPEPEQEVDPMGEIDDADTTDPERRDQLEESAAEDASGQGPRATGGTDDVERTDELDEVEEEASRDLEVDPSELTDEEPEADVRPDEDVGQRTEPEPDAETTAGAEGESERPTADGEESAASDAETDDGDDANR